MSLLTRLCIALLGTALAGTAPPAVYAAEHAPNGLMFSAVPPVAAGQREVYAVIHRYETLLNAGDTDGILELFAPDGVAEWNDKPTFTTEQERRDAYTALFRIAKFTTVFGYAGIDVHGDTAVVRTYHHEGATVLEGGKAVIDLNREVFVLRRTDGQWKISLYIFNTNPVQGEG
jgi:uncharacterized protein (TIGR02246 family)